MKLKISATIITLNEEKNIERCLKSLDFVDEIIVVDSGSNDKTVEIARKYTDKVFYRKFEGYGNQKNYAQSLAKHDIIFSIDADEEVSEELRSYLISNYHLIFERKYQAFAIPRRTFYLGKFIKNSGWYPDYKTRLYRKDQCSWDEKAVHEQLIVDGTILKVPLNKDLYHYPYKSMYDHINKLNKYTELSIIDKKDLKIVKIFLYILFKPLFKFLKMFVLKKGFLEGYRGFIIAIIGSFYEFLKYAKLIERRLHDRIFH
ncbi:glycosyltransferase family 2 protein [Deferribacter abyssi]|uniref:glycosyltransferase family 2 protein n=1 Tax=Deferribacter abyssi TaxID=213806 RepID=UPI003C231615